MQDDEEFMVSDAEALFKAKLNDEIDSINTEKGDVSGDPKFIEHINSDQYLFESLHKSMRNFTGYFVMFGLVDTPVKDPNISNFIEETTITFEIGTFDDGDQNRSNQFYKLLRYRRALRQVIMKNPDVFRSYAKPLVASLKPTSFPYDNKRVILSAGINIKASVTAN